MMLNFLMMGFGSLNYNLDLATGFTMVSSYTYIFEDRRGFGTYLYINLVKIDTSYFLKCIITRDVSSGFEIDSSCPLLFFSSEHEIISIKSQINSTAKNKRNSIFNYIWNAPLALATSAEKSVFVVYNISKEQIKIIADNKIDYVKLYYKSKKELSKSYNDELGFYFKLNHLNKQRARFFSISYEDFVLGLQCFLNQD